VLTEVQEQNKNDLILDLSQIQINE